MSAKNIPTAAQSCASIVDIMHNTAQEHMTRGKELGIVTSPPPNLAVQVNSIVLTNVELYIYDYLLPGYTRHTQGETQTAAGGSGDAAYESHLHKIDNDLTWTDTLRVGDIVAVEPLYGQNEQLYVITGRVVKL